MKVKNISNINSNENGVIERKPSPCSELLIYRDEDIPGEYQRQQESLRIHVI